LDGGHWDGLTIETKKKKTREGTWARKILISRRGYDAAGQRRVHV